MRSHRMNRWVIPLLFVGLGLASDGVLRMAAAEQIKLKDGTQFSGKLIGKDGKSVAVVVPRSDVATIDGQPLPPPVVEGAPAPNFQVVDLAGTTRKLSDYQGRVTLLQFWATWCPHCRSDLSTIKDLHERYAKLGLQVLAVSVDQDLDKLKSFVSKENLTYPVIAANAQSGSLPQLYESTGVPAYFLIDRTGLIAESLSGSVTEGKVDLEAMIKRLLPTSQTASLPADAR